MLRKEVTYPQYQALKAAGLPVDVEARYFLVINEDNLLPPKVEEKAQIKTKTSGLVPNPKTINSSRKMRFDNDAAARMQTFRTPQGIIVPLDEIPMFALNAAEICGNIQSNMPGIYKPRQWWNSMLIKEAKKNGWHLKPARASNLIGMLLHCFAPDSLFQIEE